MPKELVPIIFSCVIWGPLLARTHTQFQCDNLVKAIQKGSSKDNMVMHLLRCLWFFQALFDISIHVSHIPGMQNTAADLLSRNQMKKFLQLYPQSSYLFQLHWKKLCLQRSLICHHPSSSFVSASALTQSGVLHKSHILTYTLAIVYDCPCINSLIIVLNFVAVLV